MPVARQYVVAHFSFSGQIDERITHADGADGAPPIDGTDLRRPPSSRSGNLALRQQLAVLTRTVKRPQLRSTDRLFWILLAKSWRDWRSAQLSARTFCTFLREFSSFRWQEAADG
jgi:hypothetical protein